jgi:hypothetical protein
MDLIRLSPVDSHLSGRLIVRSEKEEEFTRWIME